MENIQVRNDTLNRSRAAGPPTCRLVPHTGSEKVVVPDHVREKCKALVAGAWHIFILHSCTCLTKYSKRV